MMDRRMRTFVALVALTVVGCARQPEPQAPTPPRVVRPGPAVGGWMALHIRQRAGVGAFLADPDGRALYMLEEDPTNESTCYGECAEVWPPVLVEARPEAGDTGVRSELIGTIERRDGRLQATYDGHPLYYHAEDAGPGTIEGQDVHDRWGGWYLVSPGGDPIHGEGA